MIALRTIRSFVSLSAYLGVLALSVAGCGSPVVGLECRSGFDRCDIACYDLQNDNTHCGSCDNACSEGQQCLAGVCEVGIRLPDGGFLRPDGGDAGNPGDGGGSGDGGADDGGDGAIDIDASRDGGDGGDSGDGGTDIDARTGDGSTGPDGASSDGSTDAGGFPIPDGATVLPDGAVILEDGGLYPPPPVPPPLCMGPGSPSNCVCDLGTTECNLSCVNFNTDHDNCGSCNFACAVDEYCNAGNCADVCTLPLILCNGQCVDFSSDDANCGSCGRVCPAAATCLPTGVIPPATPTGDCVGAAVGHTVVVGHDMSVVTRPIRQIVGNAVFLAARNPVRVLAYDAATSVPSRVGVSLAIQQSSAAIGRAYTLTVADPATITQQLGDTDVFVIEPQQGATDLELLTLGANWSTALHTFLFRGGVILLFEGGTSNGGTFQILSAAVDTATPSGLFTSSAIVPLSQRVLTLAAPADAIGASVPTEYQSQNATVGFDGVPTGGSTRTTWVITDVPNSTPGPTPSLLPVVVHTTTR